ncbi:hypothetical protein [Hymenobacter cellulosilyticus]|uniref:Uncharacterized protein n=1 Tax=Hymenobacter cellulosilyticus TaxID=2932248 RepID=A0A8T9Q3P7_9BACT|nr:hypothetical protein [Hymenobacter cellulosilyticus]UOQ71675.1 hypothetical protein MUN79_24200 [Hymenobacter cellulosilyticus]
MNPAHYPPEVYTLLYADEAGEIVGLEEVQLLEPVPTGRIPALVGLLTSTDRYLAYQCGLILAAWGVKHGVDYLRQLLETRIDKTTALEPHRLWGEDNVYDVIAEALSLAWRYSAYDKAEIVAILAEVLALYGECYFESKLKHVLLNSSIPELAPAVKQALQLAVVHQRYYQASQLLPVLAKYDKTYALTLVGQFEKLLGQDKRIQYNLEEMRTYL